MSTVKIVHGNILDAKDQYLCHQCNCVTKWAAHLAKDVFLRFPYADVYSPRIPLGYRDQPGKIKVCGNGQDQRLVVAMFAQVYPGRSRAFLDSDTDSTVSREGYFKACLDELSKLPVSSIAFPWRIGCGAAGGTWESYVDMICDFGDKVMADVTIYKMPGI